MTLLSKLWPHQIKAIEEQRKHKKCVINMWCGTGKTRTFTIELFINNEKTNVIVFPSLGLINQYCNDYVLSNEEPFKTEFEKYECLAFCSDNDGKLKAKGKINFTTKENKLHTFLKKKNKQIILVTYQSFEKFINVCIEKNININNLIFDEAHHIVGNKIQNIVFNNDKLDAIVDKTRYYTATPVNKNGIIMYDRDDPENSDCGPLAYEYLYYQAVEDGICKSFETQISLYTQKPTYKNKYQPIFESIIRACLSGKYNYWNILTYHSFVNESEDMNDNISFVKEFASPENKRLVKKLFTRIQNEEFPETKDTYSVENVILKGVHSKTPTRHQIIKNFDQKIEGRIFILSSCGILNEGIDTKWANMGVPINPTKSSVKELQRIGRLGRIPDKGMPPAILLIPCEVDITKYSSMNTPELRDQMIREELSECGNFNTALNVISAFKYQYDPELYEMCLKYPNMYAPKEVKSNLAKQGLIVGDSQGNLLENLKYVCGKEDIELDTESFKDGKDKEILKEIAEQCEKTIEIHTQNHDEPVKYINEGAVDEEPLRLFYCEDDNTYAPITKKDKKQKIKRRTTTPPKKRKPLFSVHTHPDLEVLWKIKESSIDLNKTFCQGVLDVDINWNNENWDEKFALVKEYREKRLISRILTDIIYKDVCIGSWCNTQRAYRKHDKLTEDRIKKLDSIGFEWIGLLEKIWNNKFEEFKEHIEEKGYLPKKHHANTEHPEHTLNNWVQVQKREKTNKTNRKKKLEQIYPKFFFTDKDIWDESCLAVGRYMKEEKVMPKCVKKTKRFDWTDPSNGEVYELGSWVQVQRTNFNHQKLSKERINKLNKIPGWFWESRIEKIWNDNFKKIKEFKEKNERFPSQKEEKDAGISCGWLSKQRKSKEENKMCKSQIKKLESIGFIWDIYEATWNGNYSLMEEYETINKKIPRAKEKYKGNNLGAWGDSQRMLKKNGELTEDKIKKLEKLKHWWWVSNQQTLLQNQVISKAWMKSYKELENFVKKHNKLPRDLKKESEIEGEKKLGGWCRKERAAWKRTKNGKPKHLPYLKEKIDLLNKIPGWWFEIKDRTKSSSKSKKSMTKPKISKKEKSETQTQRKERVKSEISILHKKYKTMNSQTLHKHFEENPDKWEEYHKISQANEESFPDEEIPRNNMIKYLENIPGKRKKVVVDLGCGHAEINQHFKDNKRFEFHNFDHHSSNNFVTVGDIKHTELDDCSVDICILSLAMWGSNCKDYIGEAYRILDTGGTLLIAEAYKRWNKELDGEGNPVNRLVKLLEENNFTIINNEEQKFMFIECRK